jgi:N-acetylneuraminic acid mutarotase
MAFTAIARVGFPLTLANAVAATNQEQWTRLWEPSNAEAASQPARRSAHTAITLGDYLYVYGGIGLANNGEDDDQEFNDTWAFDLTNQGWTRLAQTTSNKIPGTRFHVSGALHSNASVDEFVLFGGVSLAAMAASGGTATATTTAPVLSTSSSIPVAQYNDVWRLQLAADAPNTTAQWVKDASTNDITGKLAPLPRSEAGIAIHNDQLLLFGGISYDPPQDHDDLWSYDLATETWTQVVDSSGSASPPSRFSHSVTMIDVDSVAYLLVFSGRHLTQAQSKATWSVLSDLWLFDLASNRWASVEPSAAGVPPRAYTSVISIGSSMWFFGGYYRPPQSASGYVFDDVVRCTVTVDKTSGNNHELDTLSAAVDVKAAWAMAVGPSLRYNHAAARWGEDKMVIFGGSYQIPRSDVWVFNSTGVEMRDPSSSTLTRLPMGVETLVYVLGGFILTIIAALLVLIVRWRRIDRQNVRVDSLLGSLLHIEKALTC